MPRFGAKVVVRIIRRQRPEKVKITKKAQIQWAEEQCERERESVRIATVA